MNATRFGPEVASEPAAGSAGPAQQESGAANRPLLLRRMRKTLCLFVSSMALIACGDGESGNGGGTGAAGGAGGSAGSGGAAPLPDSWTLEAAGIRVDVTREPYGYTVTDRDGTVVLSTLSEATPRDGYGTVAWNTGSIAWTTSPITKGQFGFDPSFDEWREGWQVIAAEDAGGSGTQITLTLAPPGSEDSTERVVLNHRVERSSLRVEVSIEGANPRYVSAAFRTPADEGFLGFGERFNKTDQRGVSVFNWAEEGGIGQGEGTVASPTNPAPNGEAMTYYPVPFFVSTEGYAFWADTTWRSTFDLATDHDDAWRIWGIGPSLAYEVLVPIEGDDRLWPDQLVDLFTEKTGRPMLPPPWTYGPRRRINRGDMQMGVSEIQAMRDLDLAITAADDSLHFTPLGRHVGQEDAIRAWINDAHSLGYKVNCYYNSLFAMSDTSLIQDFVQEGIDAGHFLADANGELSVVKLISGDLLDVLQIDFTSDAATTWFQGSLDWALDLGYDGWMWDFGEYVQVDAVASNGMTGEELHNLYPVLYDRAGYEHLERSSKAGDWLMFARSGYTGSSQWVPMVWSGDPAASFEDSDGLPSMIRAGVSLGISGAPNWGGDIGGFHCVQDGGEGADGELMTRWIQQGALTPNMQDQDACVFKPLGPDKASIWDAPEAMEAWRVYARLHTRLFPYLWSLGNLAHERGTPIMRHVFFEHPDRKDLRGEDTTYYFGPSLFVAPVLNRGERQREVLFPDGRYVDWRDGSLHEAGTATIDAPLSELPLFLREGHLVVLLDPSIDTLAPESDPNVIGLDDVADVYDVAGFVSADRPSASFAVKDEGTVSVTVSGTAAPPSLPEAADEAELATCGACWLRTAIGPLNRVRIHHDGGTATAAGITVNGNVGRQLRWDLYVLE